MWISTCLLSLLFVPQNTPPAPPLALHPENPHYFLFRGRPSLMVTSGEHYGALLNLDFDFEPYFDELARHGFNQTRTFSGTYREVPGSFRIQNNTLAPQPGRFLAPWPIVRREGDREIFDLDQFEPQYFDRLRSLLREASRRGVVVEFVLFCPLYEDILWDVNPMNPRNTVQGGPDIPRIEAYTLKHEKLLDYQIKFVREVVKAVQDFDNVYFEICNEPYFGGVTLDWQRRIADAIVEAENDQPFRHLIAQNIANEHAKIEDPNPAVSIFNFHYADARAAIDNRGLGKALGDDETGFDGNDDRPYREEAWRWLLSGGALFSHLDYSFTPDTEDGSAEVKAPTPGGGGATFRSQLAFLKRFVEDFDFLHSEPRPELARKLPEKVRAAVLSGPRNEYIVHLTGGGGQSFELELPAATYQLEWFDPVKAAPAGEARLGHAGGPATLDIPELPEDVALRIHALGEPEAKAATPRIQVSENKRFLQYEDGRPFFYLADTAWELFHRLNLDETRRYLDDRAAKGFNVIQAVVLAELDGLNTPNAQGDRPLLENDPARPNEAFFRHVDAVVDLARERGLVVGMLPTWGDKVNKKWGVGPEVFNPANARAYGEFLGRRYKDAPIIWILGGDRPVENDQHRAIWPAMADGLRDGDGGRHLITYHPMGGASSADYYPDALWINFHMIQSGHSRRDEPNYLRIESEWNRSPEKPVLDAEPRYEDHPINWKPENGWFDDYDVRKALYWAVLSGGCGVTYGNHNIWQMWEPGQSPVSAARTPWFAALHQPGSYQAGHLRRLIESRPFFSRVRDLSLIAGDPDEEGDHVEASRDADGRCAIVYIPTQTPVEINLARLSGDELLAWWFDPRTGRAWEADRFSRTENQTRKFEPPSGGPDWVLVIDDVRESFKPPGSN